MSATEILPRRGRGTGDAGGGVALHRRRACGPYPSTMLRMVPLPLPGEDLE